VSVHRSHVAGCHGARRTTRAEPTGIQRQTSDRHNAIKSDLLAGAWKLHNAVPNELCVPVGKRRGEGGQEAFDVSFARVDKGGEGVMVNGGGSRLAVCLGLVLESGEVDDSVAVESPCVVGGRDGGCGRHMLLRQTGGRVVLAKGDSPRSVDKGVVLLMSHTVVAETCVKLYVEGRGSGLGVVDGGSIGDLLSTIVAINRNVFVVRNLCFICNIRVCG
jgi:hypothetical protein